MNDINRVIISGLVVSRVKHYPDSGKAVFTLQNPQGRFFISWKGPSWTPKQLDRVVITGAVHSKRTRENRKHFSYIEAETVALVRQTGSLRIPR